MSTAMNKPNQKNLHCHISFTLKPLSNPKVNITNISYPQTLTIFLTIICRERGEREREREREYRVALRSRSQTQIHRTRSPLPLAGSSPPTWSSNPYQTVWWYSSPKQLNSHYSNTHIIPHLNK